MELILVSCATASVLSIQLSFSASLGFPFSNFIFFFSFFNTIHERYQDAILSDTG
jgi:hypothetical protein